MANWWLVFPASEAAQYGNSATKPPGTVTYSTTSGTSADNALHTGGTVTINGKPYSRYIGPYSSSAAASSAVANTSTAAGIAAGISAGNAAAGSVGLPAIPGGSVSNPLAGLQSIGQFFQNLGDLNTWLRIGKVVIGAVLIFIGVAHLTSFDEKATGVAGKVLKAAPLL